MPGFTYSPSAKSRWTVLFLVAVVMMMGYVFWDIISPVSTFLRNPVAKGGMYWSSAEYGFYAGSYSIFNIFLLMLFFGGIILDRFGIILTGLLATGSMLAGALVNYYAITHISPLHYVDLDFTLFGLIPQHIKLQVLVAAMGFGLFGVGCDITGITISKIVTKWFKGHELASAMGIQVALCRLGTASAISFSPIIALNFGISALLIVGCAVLLVGFILFLLYCRMDRRFDKKARALSTETNAQNSLAADSGSASNRFTFSDFMKVLCNPGFWMIALVCVFFYSSIRPFMKFATDLLIQKYSVNSVTAGWIVSLLPYGSIILTPLFGNIFDKIGHGAMLMLAGCALTTACHVCLALPFANSTWIATAVMMVLVVAFSLVPSALWPSIPKIVPLKELGTAYSLIYYIQNIGLLLTPIYIGDVIDRHARGNTVDYTVPMVIFAMLGMLATASAAMLLVYDRKKNIGVEQANIIKK